MLYIGIDLHGTLFPDDETFDPALVGPLTDALRAVKEKAHLYVCTGNDLLFVQRKLPKEIYSLFDGFILETGCTYSDGEKEDVLVDKSTVGKIKAIEERLKTMAFPEVYKFARRLASIAMFTRYGESVQDFWKKICVVMEEIDPESEFDVIYSSVAVDVRPKRFSKITGLRRIAGQNKTAGIADSMNDIELLTGCDYGFMPKNADNSTHLTSALKSAGKKIVTLSEVMRPRTILQADKDNTAGVIDILNKISESG